MSRPRRPVLAAACIVLLLATVALWVRGLWYYDMWGRAGHRRVITAGTGQGAVWLTSEPASSYWHEPLSYESQPREAFAVQNDFPWWFTFSRPGAGGIELSVPMWFITLVPALGLSWSWRARTADKGFPVEGKAEHEKAEGISGRLTPRSARGGCDCRMPGASGGTPV